MYSLSLLIFVLPSILCEHKKFQNIFANSERAPYKSKDQVLLEKDIVKEPYFLFNEWFYIASETPGIVEANAMHLATSTRFGAVSSRMVLMKSFSKDQGFVFFTNYNSRKGNELFENPRAALTFYWEPLQRQVRVEGTASKVPDEDSDQYFNMRPYDSKIGALASDQSKPVTSRDELQEIITKLKKKYPEGSKIPRPPHWGGFMVKPYTFEFWQGQSDRVHDRFLFTREKPSKDSPTIKGDNGWYLTRLYP